MRKPSKRQETAPKAGGTAPPAGQSQADLFAQAAGMFQSGRFAEARTLFESATAGPNREMAHSARLHIRMCEQRLARGAPTPASAEEHYTYAIALLNRREFSAAREHLEKALKMAGGGDHIHCALALCLGSLGDVEGAARHLRRAIEIHPRNRAIVRHDPDFADLMQRPPIRELVGAGKAEIE
ncbi:MAG: hypothetical protein HY822_25190 [Acidobacteria bacterium]|nr:hypothetical protein [Acidobacteriota bacterium]